LQIGEKETALLQVERKLSCEARKHADEAEKSKSEHEKLLKVLVGKDSEIDSLRSEARKTFSKLKKEIDESKKVLLSKDEELKKKAEKIEELEFNIGSNKYNHDAFFQSMTDDVRKLNDKINSLEASNKKLDIEIWERNAEIESATQEKTKLENEKKLLQGRIQELEKEKSDLKEEHIASLRAKDDKLKKYVKYVTEIQSKREKIRRHSRETKRSSSEKDPNEQSAVRQGIENIQLESPAHQATQTHTVKGETPLKRSKLSQDGPTEEVKKSRLLNLANTLPNQPSPIASRTRRKIAKKESPQRKKPYPKSKPESISDASESESENQIKDNQRAKSERLGKERQKRTGLSPAKVNQPQYHSSKFRTARLTSGAKYDFEKDFTKELNKEEKKRSVKLKSLRDLKNDDEETEDEQECKVQ